MKCSRGLPSSLRRYLNEIHSCRRGVSISHGTPTGCVDGERHSTLPSRVARLLRQVVRLLRSMRGSEAVRGVSLGFIVHWPRFALFAKHWPLLCHAAHTGPLRIREALSTGAGGGGVRCRRSLRSPCFTSDGGKMSESRSTSHRSVCRATEWSKSLPCQFLGFERFTQLILQGRISDCLTEQIVYVAVREIPE